MSGDEIYVRHILDAIEKIARYTAGSTRETFLKDDLVIDGVIRELEIIGEAAGNLSESFQAGHPGIPFAAITGMRNVLAHEYFGVDLNQVWKTVQEDLPDLKSKLQALLK